MRFALAFVISGSAASTLSTPACASSNYIDKRVSAIPDASLLRRDARDLVDVRRQEVGTTLERYFEPLYFVWAISQIVAFYLFWQTGLAARLRETLRKRLTNVTQLRFAYGIALGIFGGLAAAPTSYLRYRLANTYDLSHQSFFDWIRLSLANVALDALGVGLVVAIVFAFIDRTRLWWAFSIGVLFLVTFGVNYLEPVAIAPLFDRMTPIAAASHVGRRIDAMERLAHLQNVPDFQVRISPRTNIVQGRADGFLNTKRIVIADTAIASLTDGELDVLVASALGHYVRSDGIKQALLATMLFIVCIALGVTAADRARFRRDDDPLARLSLVAAFVGIFALIALPLFHYVLREADVAADEYAIALTHEPVAAVRLYVRLSDESLEPLCPGKIQRWYFAQQPPPEERIEAALGRTSRCY